MVLPEVAPVKLRAVSSQSPELACAAFRASGATYRHAQHGPAWRRSRVQGGAV